MLAIHKRIPALFAFTGTNLRLLEVHRSFEVETFLQDKQQNSRNADAFREFFVQYWRKGAVQNRFLTVAHRPSGQRLFYDQSDINPLRDL